MQETLTLHYFKMHLILGFPVDFKHDRFVLIGYGFVQQYESAYLCPEAL